MTHSESAGQESVLKAVEVPNDELEAWRSMSPLLEEIDEGTSCFDFMQRSRCLTDIQV